MTPHILTRDEGVVTVPGGSGPALLVVPSAEAAESFAASLDAEAEPVAVSPEGITETCERHRLFLVGLYGFLAKEDLSIVPADFAADVFEVAE